MPQQARPIDSLKRILSSLSQFEKKLDKLQDDVKYHGYTLAEMRVMITNMSGADDKDLKVFSNKTTSMHGDKIMKEDNRKKCENLLIKPTVKSDAKPRKKVQKNKKSPNNSAVVKSL